MSGLWKPGDVAAVLCSDGKWRTGLHYLYMGRWTWAFGDSTFRDADTSEARPLVVIDPEDRESVLRLGELIRKHSPWTDDAPALHLTDALREFANPTPPKPDEPTGLGAVVEDADGNKWVRTDVEQPAWSQWQNAIGRWSWDRVNAVRELAPGWSE